MNSIPDIYKRSADGTGYKISFNYLMIHADLEMTTSCFVTPWILDDEDDSPIMSKEEQINASIYDEITKTRLRERWAPIKYDILTRGKFVDINGAPADSQDPGAISELTFWQNIPLSAVPDITKGSEWVYPMIIQALMGVLI